MAQLHTAAALLQDTQLMGDLAQEYGELRAKGAALDYREWVRSRLQHGASASRYDEFSTAAKVPGKRQHSQAAHPSRFIRVHVHEPVWLIVKQCPSSGVSPQSLTDVQTMRNLYIGPRHGASTSTCSARTSSSKLACRPGAHSSLLVQPKLRTSRPQD